MFSGERNQLVTIVDETSAGIDDERAGALMDGGRERVVELILTADPHADDSHADLAPRRLRNLQNKSVLPGEPVIQERSNGCGLRHEVMQQIEPLGYQI